MFAVIRPAMESRHAHYAPGLIDNRFVGNNHGIYRWRCSGEFEQKTPSYRTGRV